MRIYNTEIWLAQTHERRKQRQYDWVENRSRKTEGEALAHQVIAELKVALVHGPRGGKNSVIVRESGLFSAGTRRLNSTSLQKLWGPVTIVRDWCYRHGLTVSLKKDLGPETKTTFCYLVISRPPYRHRLSA